MAREWQRQRDGSRRGEQTERDDRPQMMAERDGREWMASLLCHSVILPYLPFCHSAIPAISATSAIHFKTT